MSVSRGLIGNRTFTSPLPQWKSSVVIWNAYRHANSLWKRMIPIQAHPFFDLDQIRHGLQKTVCG
jgi:hypothetical protein